MGTAGEMKAKNLQLFFFLVLVRISVCCMSKQPEPTNGSLAFVDSEENVLDANRNNWKPTEDVIAAFRDTPYPGVEN